MRIISGNLSGRPFTSPHSSKTHPMSDKIRGALFNILGDITGLQILDAFSGSGAISFEALSRGATYIIAIDTDMTAYKTIVSNSQALGLHSDQLKVINANCFSWSARNSDKVFDIVIADPPYTNKRLKQDNVFKMLIHVQPGGLFVVSLPPSNNKTDLSDALLDNFQELTRKDYGDAQLVFYRRIS